jgi:hypothetical protein
MNQQAMVTIGNNGTCAIDAMGSSLFTLNTRHVILCDREVEIK